MFSNFLCISFRLSIIIWEKILIVCSETHFRKNPNHIETSQLISTVNQLSGFYTIQLLTERCFRAGYNLIYNFNLKQWWEAVKQFLFREDNTPLHTINCFLSSNNNVCSLISCID